MEVIKRLSYKLDREEIAKKIGVSDASPLAQVLDDVLKDAGSLLKPSGAFKIAYIEEKKHDSIRIDHALFKSRVLRINLDNTGRVFPFVVTCGQAYESLHKDYDGDIVKTYILNEVANAILVEARETLFQGLQKRYALGITSKMSPGSLEDWPLEEQQQLFSLFGHEKIKEALGVSLTPNFLMLPVKSVSGIMFESEKSFHNCQLCPREACPSRKAPYNEVLLQYYEAQQ